ncbi:MAG TPA: alpha/beta fold hydrolase [Candidatus Didemnitutus sp.]|nr:alpha/beta fold hydrolase [Candidatus Didemnitutus sp.]
MSHVAHRCAGISILALLTTVASASPKIDLNRIAPVAANEPIPVADFFRPPLLSQPELNAAGDHFVALVDMGDDHTAMMVCELASGHASIIRGSGDKDVDWVEWLDDTHVLSNVLADKIYADGLYVTDIAHPDDTHLVESHSAVSLVGVPVANPMHPLVWIYRNAYDDGKDMGVVEINPNKWLGRMRDSSPGSVQGSEARDETDLFGTRASIARTFPAPKTGGVVTDYLPDKNGDLAFAIAAEDGTFTLFEFSEGSWSPCPVNLDKIEVIGAGNQPHELVVIAPGEPGKPRPVQLLDASTGKLGAVLIQDKGFDVSGSVIYRHPVSRRVVGLRYNRVMRSSSWFDDNYGQVQKMLATKFPGEVVQIMGSDRKENRFFVLTYSDRQPPQYHELDLAAKSIALVKSASPWIDAARMRPMSVVKIPTRDGHQIDAYVTMPAPLPGGAKPPLVVLPHGGPWARDVWGFDGEVQFLASRGYAVLQPNYRGSIGTTWMFPDSDSWAFRKMHDDVTDSVKALVKSGLVDPHRIAIMGTSFGGYLAMCGATFEPDLYRCAITIAGVFDWAQVMREKKSHEFEFAAYGIFRRNLGNPANNPQEFDRISPLRHVDQVKIPIFVAHGKDDEVAEVTESKALLSELDRRHVVHEKMLFSGEGHGLSYATHQADLYAHIEAFLARNLAATP